MGLAYPNKDTQAFYRAEGFAKGDVPTIFERCPSLNADAFQHYDGIDSSRNHHPGNPTLDAPLRSHREFAANMHCRLFPNVSPRAARFTKWMFADATIRYIGTQTFVEDDFLANCRSANYQNFKQDRK